MAEYTLRVSDDELRRYRKMAELAVARESDAFAAAGIVPGATVADVGCGPAAVAAELGRMVGPEGRVIGVERAAEARAAAEVLLADGPGNVEIREGLATDTGLDPGSVDVVMLRHVLAHNGGDEQAIVDHLATLPRSGGSVYLLDVDFHGMRLLDADPDIDELYERYEAFHRARGNDVQVGLRLGRFARAAGLVDVHHEGWFDIVEMPQGMRGPAWAAREAMLADGIASEEDVARWDAAYERDLTREDRPTMFAPLFSAVGRVA